MLSLDSFNEEINKITRDFTQKKILLAVSGGTDSMVMLDLFRKRSAEQSDFMISAAHINYKLRGEDSDLDQKIVEDYCEKHEIPLSVYSVSEKDNKPENGSIQLWARELRYRFFHQPDAWKRSERTERHPSKRKQNSASAFGFHKRGNI